AGAWQVGVNSTLDPFNNVLRESGLTILDKFTGLTDGIQPPSIPYVVTNDISNKGTRFWVAYGHHYGFNTNSQDMVLYLSAEEAANVQVKVNGTPYVKNYSIAANTVRVSEIIPKYGLVDARITDEGLFDRGISITSDKPIVAYAHIYDGSNSGASMLLPVGVYGYEYVSLNASQYYPAGGAGSFSWFNVITDRDSTMIEITPSVATKGGRPANVPFTVLLMKGQVYNVMGTQTGATGTDLTGSRIRAIPNASGKCYPFAVFSGSSRTAICYTTNGDNMIQQVLPSQAWGKKYATFATARSTSNTTYNSNIFRVMVKDPATVVRHNGTVLNQSTLVTPGNYYEFSTTSGDGPNGAVYIEADKPVLVAQYMVSSGATQCAGVTTAGSGDPEMIYISPLEQGIKKAVFYNTDQEAILANYINVVVPTTGLASLRIDGNSTFTDVFAHPYLPGYTSIRHNLGAAAGQHIIQCDSAFTAITYGLGTNESYGYNAGTLVRNLNSFPSISNVFSTTGSVTDTTCSKTPFRFSILSPLKPTVLEWQLSAVPNMTPNTNIVQNNPAPADSVIINGVKVYRFELTGNYTITGTGTYYVPIIITHPDIESCGNRQENTLTIHVAPAPFADFSSTFTGCQNDPVAFTGIAVTNNNTPVSSWSWDFGGGAPVATGQTPTHVYPTAGTFPVHMSYTTANGCLGDTTKSITVNPRPVVVLVEDTVAVCQGSTAQFAVQNPLAGVTYSWYAVPASGTALSNGTTFTAPAVNGTVLYYVEGEAAGCISNTRTIATAMLMQPLATPVVTADSIGINTIRFRWNAVPGAAAYEVSLDGGTTWTAPSSGTTGLTHTVGGLLPLQNVTITVRALGVVACQNSVSAPFTERSRPDEIFIPNSFTPNGDGLNDVLQVYGYGVTELQFTVFNQWGEKIADSRDQRNAWDGTYKGKAQPSGVYLYVCRIVLANGTVLTKKGSINLVR
ncbi:MAG: T9SS type B sorting domain-containing protein, partial [Chitinophagaceae bacterium]